MVLVLICRLLLVRLVGPVDVDGFSVAAAAAGVSVGGVSMPQDARASRRVTSTGGSDSALRCPSSARVTVRSGTRRSSP
ncbi:hypothetical protein ASG06_17700 [Rathayibacter sp. Leaf185]|nr:hypothetical protein ASF42_18910 [Rathayibacter sp. Leaf294]KQS08572.1 hypothetical protein ASG06_17700 [Rathayibacter sp. Leaf185]